MNKYKNCFLRCYKLKCKNLIFLNKYWGNRYKWIELKNKKQFWSFLSGNNIQLIWCNRKILSSILFKNFLLYNHTHKVLHLNNLKSDCIFIRWSSLSEIYKNKNRWQIWDTVSMGQSKIICYYVYYSLNSLNFE